MGNNTFDVESLITPDQKANEIALKWDKWKSDRGSWEDKTLETRQYLMATDTRSTTNAKLPFKNSTTIPKLAQLAQNLKANYAATLFGASDWANWEAANEDAAQISKKRAVEAYIRTKLRMSDAESVYNLLLDDWIQTGVCFAQIAYVNQSHISPRGEVIPGYVGPKLQRISPYDVVFNLAADSWESSPKIVRSLVSIGDIARMVHDKTNILFSEELLEVVTTRRRAVRSAAKEVAKADIQKSSGYIADGFGSLTEYYNSDMVEILTFYGDWYDIHTGTYNPNHQVVVVDRATIAYEGPIDSWDGNPHLYYSAWRKRPDNLMGMGPLDNLVGMQYKIDKLENLRADVFDQFANPTVVEVGQVEFFGVRGAPGGRYVVEEGGAVQYLRPDSSVLAADLQINQAMQLMEELAGAPREAMGIRSPGEKTKFEVQVLDNAANRLFRQKARQFEDEIVVKTLNGMLEVARDKLDGTDLVRMQDSTFGTDQFLSVTKEDLRAAGKLYAAGSRTFEKQANAMQNLNIIFNSPVGQLINPHISRKQLATVVEDLLSAEQFKLVQENIGVLEDIATQKLVQQGQQELEELALTPDQLESDDEEVV